MNLSTQENNTFKLENLPISSWHWKTFFLLGFGLQFNGFLNSSGNSILADLVARGWSNNYLNATFTSMMMIGFFIGSIVGGFLGDKVGRKKAYEASIGTFALFSLIAAISPNMYFLIICRLLMGIGMGSGIVLGYGSFTEFIPATSRGKWQARLSFIGNLSPLIATLVCAIVIPKFSWRMVFLIGSFASFIILGYIHKYFTESPRWLLQNGYTKEGSKILKKIITESLNQEVSDDSINNLVTSYSTNRTVKEKKIPLSSFFHGALGRRTLVSSVTLIAMNLSLYTINTWVPTIFVNRGIDISKSLTMWAAITIACPLGVFASTFIMDLLPRKYFGAIFILLISILGYVYSIQKSEAYIIIIGFVMMFILYIYNSFSSAVYGPEVWPTEAKMRGLGIADAIGRLVSIFSPYLIAWLLTDYGPIAVFTVVGLLLAICAFILLLFGIETRGKTCEKIDDSINLETNTENKLRSYSTY